MGIRKIYLYMRTYIVSLVSDRKYIGLENRNWKPLQADAPIPGLIVQSRSELKHSCEKFTFHTCTPLTYTPFTCITIIFNSKH